MLNTLYISFNPHGSCIFIDANIKSHRNSATCLTFSTGELRSNPSSADFIAQVLPTIVKE